MATRPAVVHRHAHAFGWLHGQEREGLTLTTRRGMLKASMAGVAGLTLPRLLRARAEAAAAGNPLRGRKSVILLWMAGGPSHIDTWDPKPDRPYENRGPFGTISTKVPGVQIIEHLPKQAAMLDKLTIIRSVDARHSGHATTYKVFQTGSIAANRNINPKAELVPAMGAVAAKYRGAKHPAMPPYVAFMTSPGHIAFGGFLGKQYDPFIGQQAARLPVYTNVGVDTGEIRGGALFGLPAGLTGERLEDRRSLLRQFDRLRADVDVRGSMQALDSYSQQAVDMVLGKQAQEAFDLDREPQSSRDRYGKHLWCQEALLARRLVEAGVAFVTLDLSYHPSSGTWDTHGDNIPPYGGIRRGLGPLLPLFDHLTTTLISDLDERGLLDDTLVLAMGEFG
ncbi:MAG: DUF1501 domain-containing protein, partial [Pirellulaceae bacterium]